MQAFFEYLCIDFFIFIQKSKMLDFTDKKEVLYDKKF